MVVRNEQGQTVVEYILLLTVSLSLVLTLYRSQAFQRLFGDQGSLGKTIKLDSEFSYRHAFGSAPQPERNTPFASAEAHPSYFSQTKSQTRFFGPVTPYE